jgi:hypothetical protein
LSILISPAGGPPVTLSPGDLTTIINGAAAGGTPISQVFNVRVGGNRDAQAPTLNLYAVGGGATVIAATLQVSGDGGTTWQTAPNGGTLNFVTSPDQTFTVIPGKLYRLNVGTLTGGTGLTVNAGVS